MVILPLLNVSNTYEGLVLVLFVPALRRIRNERFAILRIFLSVPKTTVNGILNSLDNKNQVKEIEESAVEEISSGDNSTYFEKEKKNAMPILKRISIRYGLYLGITFAMAVGMFIVGAVFIQRTTTTIPSLVAAGKRLACINELKFLATELIRNDEVTWGSRDAIRVYSKEVICTHFNRQT